MVGASDSGDRYRHICIRAARARSMGAARLTRPTTLARVVLTGLVSVLQSLALSAEVRAAETFTCDIDPFVITTESVQSWTGSTSAGNVQTITVESLNPQCVLLAARGSAKPPTQSSITSRSGQNGDFGFRMRCAAATCESSIRFTAVNHDERQCTVRCSVPTPVCKEKKAKAIGFNVSQLLKAFGKNKKRPNSVGLASDISKAQSKLTRAFTRAEFTGSGVPRLCATAGDVAALEAKSQAIAEDVIDEVCPTAVTTTSTTTSTLP